MYRKIETKLMELKVLRAREETMKNNGSVNGSSQMLDSKPSAMVSERLFTLEARAVRFFAAVREMKSSLVLLLR